MPRRDFVDRARVARRRTPRQADGNASRASVRASRPPTARFEPNRVAVRSEPRHALIRADLPKRIVVTRAHGELDQRVALSSRAKRTPFCNRPFACIGCRARVVEVQMGDD
mgnify:CR=1 FL=1